MDSKIDVLNELRNKNKEIYLNKLIIDIDNNSEILEITISNMIELITSEMINKICEIQTTIEKEKIEQIVKFYQEKTNNELIKLIHNRCFNLKSSVCIDNDFNYKEKLDIETNNLIIKFNDFYRKNVLEIIKKLEIDLDSFNKNRLVDYLNVLLFDKLNGKLKEILNDKDMILCNNYQAGFAKYQNMNEKTLNRV